MADLLGFRVEGWFPNGDPRCLAPAASRDVELLYCTNLVVAFTVKSSVDSPTDYFKKAVKLAYPVVAYMYEKGKREKIGKIVRYRNDPKLRIKLGKGETVKTDVKPFEKPVKEAA
jgi:hypothetical protein